jgi:NAD(P)-dependent dehydrogenase (short-subunit alcohol dehydrogenase family)
LRIKGPCMPALLCKALFWLVCGKTTSPTTQHVDFQSADAGNFVLQIARGRAPDGSGERAFSGRKARGSLGARLRAMRDTETMMSGSPDVFALPEGLRVLITAGASGIGRAISELLIGRGARVHICDISDDLLAEYRAAHPALGATKADVASEADVSRLFDEVEKSFGGLDSLINNAGIAGPSGGVEEIRPEDWRRTIDVCLTGQFLCAHHAVPMLKATGVGAIVNLSSAAGRFGYAFRTPYSAAKWGVIGFTQSLAKELGPSNIRVNAILPGIVEGPRMAGVIAARAKQLDVAYEAMEETYLDRVSLRRMVSAGDVAATVAYLLSPAGRNISGQSIGVDGNVEAL